MDEQQVIEENKGSKPLTLAQAQARFEELSRELLQTFLKVEDLFREGTSICVYLAETMKDLSTEGESGE